MAAKSRSIFPRASNCLAFQHQPLNASLSSALTNSSSPYLIDKWPTVRRHLRSPQSIASQEHTPYVYLLCPFIQSPLACLFQGSPFFDFCWVGKYPRRIESSEKENNRLTEDRSSAPMSGVQFIIPFPALKVSYYP
jgi:hypothetical protein